MCPSGATGWATRGHGDRDVLEGAARAVFPTISISVQAGTVLTGNTEELPRCRLAELLIQ